MLILHQFEISPYCDKVRRILDVKRQPYEIREVSLLDSATRLRKLNPAGKLPCLEHEGRVVADSTDIAHYLEERFPEPPLLPKQPHERALCHVLEDWADESLYFYEMTLRFALPHNAERWAPKLLAHDNVLLRTVGPALLPRVMKSVLRSQGVGRKPMDSVLRDVDRHLDAVVGLLGDGEWLVGGALSLADIAVFAQLFCVRGSQEGETAIAARPMLVAWMQRVDRATAPTL